MFLAGQPVAAHAQSADQSDVIEIVGQRSDQALKIDRRTYRVQQTPHSQEKDAIQLLRGLPAVTVSPDENIDLLGSGNVTIFIDGRAYQGDSKSYLRSLHGSDIERIEIITNPSAQYSAEGTGGIINFVLRKKQREGASGAVTAEVSNLGHGYVDATLKTKHGKWTYEFHLGGRAGASSRTTYYKLRSTEELPGGPATVNTEDGGGRYRGAEVETSAKASYELSPRSVLSAKVLALVARDVNNTKAKFVGLTPDFQSFNQLERFTTAASALISELNFDHKGNREGETLTASLRVFGNPTQHETNAGEFSDGGALSVDKRKRFFFASGQLDWQHPIGKGQILSLGGSVDYDRMSEQYRFASIGKGGSLGDAASNQFSGVDRKLAGYATFQQPVGGWTVMPGVRMERDSRQITSPGHPDVAIARTDVFPTFHVDHRLGKALDLTLSYSKRIDRPSLNDLRPYGLVQDVLTIKEGNPHLKDQSTDAYEVNLHYHRKKVDAGLILYDRETSRLWSPSYTAVDGVNVFTWINSGRRRSTGAEFDAATPILPRLKFNTSVNLFYVRAPADGPDGRSAESTFRYTSDSTLEWDAVDRGELPGDVAQVEWRHYSRMSQFQIEDFARNGLSMSYTHSFSRTLSLSATMDYWASFGHTLEAPLVQELYREHSPVQVSLKLLKRFGAP